MTEAQSRDAAYFERIYSGDPDPWQFASSPYEKAKYTASLEALTGRRFVRGMEIGCSIGVLTRRLAGQCDALLGVDIAESPLREARARCADLPHVSFARLAVPAQWPEGQFDLIVLSEVLYFLAPADVARMTRRVLACLMPGGCVLLVNWLGESDNPCGGDEAARIFIAASEPRLTPVIAQRQPEYRLDLLGWSVA
jgi:cyclopropane fatty-acyl-phospholipid synthase-like methyltransferase